MSESKSHKAVLHFALALFTAVVLTAGFVYITQPVAVLDGPQWGFKQLQAVGPNGNLVTTDAVLLKHRSGACFVVRASAMFEVGEAACD